eukprot:5522936-Amphidinium_carterae.1
MQNLSREIKRLSQNGYGCKHNLPSSRCMRERKRINTHPQVWLLTRSLDSGEKTSMLMGHRAPAAYG